MTTKDEETRIIAEQAYFKLTYERIANVRDIDYETESVFNEDRDSFENSRWCLWYRDKKYGWERFDIFESLSDDDAAAYLKYARSWIKHHNFVRSKNEPACFDEWFNNDKADK